MKLQNRVGEGACGRTRSLRRSDRHAPKIRVSGSIRADPPIERHLLGTWGQIIQRPEAAGLVRWYPPLETDP